MTKKIFALAALVTCFILLAQFSLNAQDKKKILERPAKCEVREIDEFVSKTFDSYDESVKITDDLNLIKVEGDGKTTPVSVKNGKGEELSKEAALKQLEDLLNRAKKQNDNIKALQDLQKPAQESLKKCSMAQKPKAAKSLGKGGEALNEVIKQTKTQLELIEKQISYVKTMKDSKTK